MAEDRTRRPEDEEPRFDEQESGRGDEEFDDTPGGFDDEEDEREDEDLDVQRDLATDASFTAEIGSEGGSRGDVEVERKRPRVTQGSEATTTATSRDDPSFRDRKEGPGY